MAQTFSPRFVDLVRNYTTTVGTADFALGPVVNGYSGFATALNAGDRFYYSCVGVDRPAEREVGRGTLTDKGTIVREPVSGTKTNFSSGTKSIALIAASEWFDDVHAAVRALGSASIAELDADAGLAADSDSRVPTQKAVRTFVNALPGSAADRAALSASAGSGTAFLREKGREGQFAWDGSDLSAKVSSDPAQGIFIPPASDRSGKSGAWVRKFDAGIRPEWFGAVCSDVLLGPGGANCGANDAAFAAMFTTLAALSVNTTSNFRGLRRLQLGLGTYEIGSTIELNAGSMVVDGHGMGHFGGTTASGGTRIKAYGCTAIRIQSSNTSGVSTGDAALHVSSDQAVLRDFGIEGDFAAAEADYHGVHARASAHCQNICVVNMRGDGFRFEGNTSGMLGSVNSSTLLNCHAWSNRNGWLFNGNNSGACTIIGGSLNNNRRWGYRSTYSIAQALTGVEASNNGTVAANDGVAIPATVVSYGGNRYFCIIGQEAGASTNAPSGTAADNSWWGYLAAGAAASGIPAWTSGMLVDSGGCYAGVGGNSFIGCYAEMLNQGAAQIAAGDLVLGGKLTGMVWANTPAAKAAVIGSGTNGMVQVRGGLQSSTGTVDARLGDQNGNPSNRILYGSEPTQAPSGYSLFFNSNDLLLSYNSSLTAFVFKVTGPSTTQQFGTGAPVPQAMYVAGLRLGATITNARQITFDTAAPTTGAWAFGDFIHNRLGTVGLVGWRCTAAGTPGNWEAVYSGYGAGPVGYASGGAASQATSKATGVTVNKLSGQVTTNGASLAAGATVTFTVTDNQVAASDTINLSLASGALTPGSYRYWVEAVAAGSFKVTVENRSAAALAEALMFNFAVLKAAAA